MTAPEAGLRVAIVTPARNEAPGIEETVRAVRAQTRPPVAWVIVDDGSTDGTAQVAADAADGVPWITVVRRQDAGREDFVSKAHAFRRGLAELDGVEHDLLANLDADITLPPDYLERLTREFTAEPELGVAGGRVDVEENGRIERRRASADAVAGAVQCFRRACFDEIGGIPALRRGGEDAAAEIAARSRGWSVRTIEDLAVVHRGPVLNRHPNALVAFWSRGIVNRGLGYDPLFQLLAAVYRCADRPYVLGGAALFGGYAWAALRRVPLMLPDEVVAHLRREQRDRVRRLVRRG